MNELRWCCRCQHVSRMTSEAPPSGDLVCPYCGAGCGNLQTWSSVREWNPHWPGRPTVGKAYRIRRRAC